MWLRSLRIDGVGDSLNTLLPTGTCYHSKFKFGHLVKPYERKFGDPLRSRLSKSLVDRLPIIGSKFRD